MNTRSRFWPRSWHLAAAVAACLSFFRPAAAAPELIAHSGPFGLEQITKRSGLQFSYNFGFHRVEYFKFRVHFRGQPVQVPDGRGGRQTEFRDAWVLSDAVRPAVLVGGDQWALITERNGQAHAEPLGEGTAMSLQRVDGARPLEHVASGRVRIEPSSAADLELRSGRLLLLNRATLLDVQTLRAQPLAPKVPDGYRLPDAGLLGAAPDGRAVALMYVGPSLSARDALVVVASTQGNEQALLPLDLMALTGIGHVVATPALLQQHFRWETSPGTALPALRPLPAASLGPWQSRHLYGLRAVRDEQGAVHSRFELTPVRPSMLEAARAHLHKECGCDFVPISGSGDTATLQLKLTTATAVMRVDAKRRTLRRLDRISIARDELLDNCRNTREVAYQTSILSTLEVAVEGAPSGPSCECAFYGSPAEGVARIETELQRLLAADVKPSDIVVLSTRRRENSMIAGNAVLAGLPVRDVAEGPAAKSIAFCTMHAFKGLERSVVIAVDLGEIGQSEWAMIHYAGLSRARTLLLPLVPQACERRYREMVAAFGRRISRG